MEQSVKDADRKTEQVEPDICRSVPVVNTNRVKIALRLPDGRTITIDRNLPKLPLGM